MPNGRGSAYPAGQPRNAIAWTLCVAEVVGVQHKRFCRLILSMVAQSLK